MRKLLRRCRKVKEAEHLLRNDDREDRLRNNDIRACRSAGFPFTPMVIASPPSNLHVSARLTRACRLATGRRKAFGTTDVSAVSANSTSTYGTPDVAVRCCGFFADKGT